MSWNAVLISDVETLPPFLNVTRMVREQQRCLTRFPRRTAYFPRELLLLISCSDLALGGANIKDACTVLSNDAVWTEKIKTIWLNIIVFIFTILLHYTKQAYILNTPNTLIFFMIWLVPKKPPPPPYPVLLVGYSVSCAIHIFIPGFLSCTQWCPLLVGCTLHTVHCCDSVQCA